jgi:hypothetical protein
MSRRDVRSARAEGTAGHGAHSVAEWKLFLNE